jgi:Domain of unknown function (DUF1963)
VHRGGSRRAFLTGLIARDLFDDRDARPRAPLPGRCATAAELRELAGSAGLAEPAERLAAVSVRFEPGTAGTRRGTTRFGGPPDLPEDVAWPAVDGRRLPFLGQVATAELPRVPAGWRRSDDLVLLFGDARAAQVLRLPRPRGRLGRPRAPRGDGAALAAELTLPRAWAAPVQELGLAPEALGRWSELRRALARAQDAQLEDEHTGTRVVHRLGGYPDERTGGMPALCELRARGLPSPDGDPDGAVAAIGATAATARWRLLAQLSADPATGWDWGRDRRRLYLWADPEDLASVVAIAR